MKKLLLLLSACALVFAGDSSRYREDFHYSYPQTAGGRFSLDNFNGSVEITGWDQNTVDISGTKYAESQSLLNSMQIEASSSGNAVRVKTTRPDPHHGNMGAKYVIRVPRQTALEDVASSNGSIRADDIDGNAHLTTSNGSIHLGKINGNVDAHSSNGSIEVKDVKGNVNFTTSNGGVHAENVEGAFEAETSNGGIHAHLARHRQRASYSAQYLERRHRSAGGLPAAERRDRVHQQRPDHRAHARQRGRQPACIHQLEWIGPQRFRCSNSRRRAV